MNISSDPHLPQQVPIDAYGKGGFRFGGMSHRGSVLCLPAGIWAWSVARPEDITGDSFARVFAADSDIELFLLGSGTEPWFMPEDLRWRFRDYRIGVDVMPTGAAARTYNILLGERRRVAAGLIAV